MAELKVEIDPAEAGFDAARLARLDAHFARYVADGRLPGWLLLVSRRGHVVHVATNGQRDMEAGLPLELDTLFRIYSMTKPITSVAAMMLYEEGGFELKDPVSRYIPSFKDMRVYRQGSPLAPVTEPATEPVRIWHLLTHTAGLTYGFHHVHPVDALYRSAGYEWGSPPDKDLAQCCDDWAGVSSAGDFGWGGAASTAFWVDPAEEITALFMTQLLPSSTHPIRPQLKQLVYQALVD